MPNSFINFDSTGRLKVEIEEQGGSVSYADALLESLQTIATLISSQMSRMAENERPRSLEIVFGVKSAGGDALAVSLGRDRANFVVSMQWSRQESPSRPPSNLLEFR